VALCIINVYKIAKGWVCLTVLNLLDIFIEIRKVSVYIQNKEEGKEVRKVLFFPTFSDMAFRRLK